MQSISPFQAVDAPAPQAEAPPFAAAPSTDPAEMDFAEICIQQTSAALHQCRAASPMELSQAIAAVREAHAEGSPADLIEAVARLQGHDEEFIGPAIVEIGNKVASTLTPCPPLIPFGGKLIAPSAFYDSFDQLHKIARTLLSPIIYAEDTDSIGTASINPVASTILAIEIRKAVFKRFGINPFITVAQLDYENWTFLSRKHFEL